MDENKSEQTRILPEKLDVYVIGDDGTVSSGAGCVPDVYIEEQSAGRLFEHDTALYILEKFGRVVGVMRDSKFCAEPKAYRTRKMILGKVNLP